jgi:SpoIVB peptidase S55
VRGFVGRFTALTVPAVVGALVWAGLAAAAPPAPCAPVMPLEDVTAGMTGTGWTVAHGTDPETFDVEVLGVVPGLMAPGRDIIIAKISGPLIDAAGGGVWAGMSGSPVYVGGQLIGAVALSFSLGPSNITGLTPAEEMLTVGGYPATTARQAPLRVRLPRAMRSVIARSTGSTLSEVGDTLVRLKVPVSVSGLTMGRTGLVDDLLARRHVAAVTYAGSSVSASLTPGVDSLVPGGNFAAALSYGDLTVAGVGTTTYVCDGMALAFGHPLLWTGRAALGAGGADAVTVVTDPTLSPFKLANVTAPLGRVDQDRLAGVRAVDADLTTIPVQTAVSSLDTGLARVGETDVVLPSEFPILSAIHLVSNIDSVFDERDAGSSSVSWTITGEHPDGTPWEVQRANMYVSDYDLSVDSVLDLLDGLETLVFNPFEKVKFTGVDATASVEDTVRTYELTALLVCRGGICDETDTLFARGGQTIRLKAILTPSDGSDPEEVPFAFTIPRRPRAGGLIQVGAPNIPRFCFAPERCDRVVDSFSRLLRVLRRQAPNNLLVGTLRSGPAGRVKQRQNELFDQVVLGTKYVTVFYPRQCCPPEPADDGEPEPDFGGP